MLQLTVGRADLSRRHFQLRCDAPYFGIFRYIRPGADPLAAAMRREFRQRYNFWEIFRGR